MEAVSSLSCSQDPATEPYTDLPPRFFKIQFMVTLSSKPVFSQLVSSD
jgi:hypothetical protein